METLIDLLQTYEELLCNKLFSLTLEDGSVFDIKFELNNFAHLLGIQYCSDTRNIKEYSGLRAVENIRDGIITFEKLEKSNYKQYTKFVMRKREAFKHFCDLFPNSKDSFDAIIFDAKRVVEMNDRELGKAVLIFQNKYNPSIKYVFMFGQERPDKPLFPLSFRKEITQTIDYLDLQTKYRIEKLCVTE